jgi:glutaminyl-peptide cyclotransferase
MYRLLFSLTVILGIQSCNSQHSTPEVIKTAEDIPALSFNVAAVLPHDTLSFTEGFLFHNGQLYESTGSPQDMEQTRSVFGPVNLQTGKIDIKGEIDRKKYFGEGIAFFNNRIFQLTYQNQICFVYDEKTLKKIGQYNFSNKEGWGFTKDSTCLIMSDGTDVLTYLNPDNFQVVKKLHVTANNYAVENVNEPEYIHGYIYANIWPTDKVIKIDPATGNIVGKFDFSELKQRALGRNPQSMETNGIAYDPATDKIYVTGKMWPFIFQIEFNH